MSYQSEVLADSPVAYWPLDDAGPTAADLGPHGYTLSTPPGPVNGVPGPFGDSTAVRFRQSGVITGTQSVLPTNVALTLEAWVKDEAASSPSPGNPSFVLGYGDATFVEGFVALLTYPLGPSYTYMTAFYGWTSASMGFPGLAEGAPGGTAVAAGAWHHVLITMTNTTASIYLDGVGQGGNPGDISFWPLQAAPSVGSFWIGSMPGTGQALWGDVAYCAVYGSVLSGTRIAAHAACTTDATYRSAVLADSPLAFWPLQEA